MIMLATYKANLCASFCPSTKHAKIIINFGRRIDKTLSLVGILSWTSSTGRYEQSLSNFFCCGNKAKFMGSVDKFRFSSQPALWPRNKDETMHKDGGIRVRSQFVFECPPLWRHWTRSNAWSLSWTTVSGFKYLWAIFVGIFKIC